MHLDSVFQKLSSYVLIVAVLDLMAVNRMTAQQCVDQENTIFAKYGIKIEPHLTSRVRVHTTSFHSHRARLSFSIKTNSSNGLLFYGTRKENENRLVSLSIQEGRLKFIAKCSSANLDIDLNYYGINDGRWHNITFKKEGPYGIILVDGGRYSRRYQVNCKLNYFEFGGLSPKYYYRLYRGIIPYRGHYEGCIGNLYISSLLTDYVVYKSVSSCQFD